MMKFQFIVKCFFYDVGFKLILFNIGIFFYDIFRLFSNIGEISIFSLMNNFLGFRMPTKEYE
jgi:hypothetical protein